jgi:hypothetical protein
MTTINRSIVAEVAQTVGRYSLINTCHGDCELPLVADQCGIYANGLLAGTDTRSETKQVPHNLRAILESLGAHASDPLVDDPDSHAAQSIYWTTRELRRIGPQWELAAGGLIRPNLPLEEADQWRHLSDGVITSCFRSCSASWLSTLPIAGNGRMACDEK